MLPSELLANPAAWIQGDLAQDSRGNVVDDKDPDACRWCMLGALSHCAPNEEARNLDLSKLRAALDQAKWDAGAVFFNDTPGRTHAEVIALLKSAGL